LDGGKDFSYAIDNLIEIDVAAQEKVIHVELS
jgi:hypothetical protein